MDKLITFFAIILPTVVFAALVLFWKRFLDKDDRRSPINTKLHFTPGEQLRRRIEDIDENINSVLMALAISGPGVAAMWLITELRRAKWVFTGFNPFDLILLVLLVSVGVWSTRRIVFLGKQRRRMRQGLAAEIAVGQYLLPLMGRGCIVFNDIPAEGFNIDHIVIGPCAVFAVETKSRKKGSALGKESAMVTYDGQTLRFPGYQDSKPLDQSKSQARWLSTFLANAAGEPVRVIPVVSLPGWWIENKKQASPPEVWVTNGKNANFMLNSGFGPALSESLRTRIAYAITQRYPDPD